MIRPHPLPVLLLLLAAAAAGAPSLPADEGAVTVIGTGTLRRSSLVVRGTLERVSALPYGVEMATVKVVEVLWKEGPGGDPKRVQVLSNEPGFFSRVAEDSLWFLHSLSGRDRYGSVATVDLSDRAAEVRLAAVRRSLEIEALPAHRRAAELRRTCFEGLGAGDAWTRRNAGREIAHLASIRPDAFTEADAGDVADRAMREGDRLLRPLLVEAAESLARAASRGALAPAEEGRVSLEGAPAFRALRGDADRVRRLEAVEGVRAAPGPAADEALATCLREDRDPGVRAAAAAAMGNRPSSPAAVKGLLGSLEAEKEPAVRVAAVEALGRLEAPEAVAPLRPLCGEGDPLGRAALFALGRIATPGAEGALREFQRSLDATREDAAALRDLVDFLLSADFRRQEETLRGMREGK